MSWPMTPLCGWHISVAYWPKKKRDGYQGAYGHSEECQQLGKSPYFHGRSTTIKQMLLLHYLLWLDQQCMEVCMKCAEGGGWGNSAPPGWREGWDQTQVGLPCQEDSGRNDFTGREQPDFNGDDARKGAAMGKQHAERALASMQCMVLAQGPTLAKDRIWYL